MADVEHLLLSKAVLHGEMGVLAECNIIPEFFMDDQYREIFSYMLKHWKEYGISPDAEVMRRNYPAMKWVDDRQPTMYFIDQVRLRRKGRLYDEALSEVVNVMDEDPEKRVNSIEQIIQDALRQARVETSGTRDTDFIAGYEAVIQRIGERRINPSHLRGLSTGIHGIDVVTGGLQPEQFLVITGVPKSGKSSFLLYMALNVWMAGKTPLFLGFEMGNAEQEDRLASLMGEVSLSRVMNGLTSRHEHTKLIKALRKHNGMHPFMFSADIMSGTTVAGVQAKIQQYQPDAVFIDGVYMMESELDPKFSPKGSPQALTNISRSLKRLAQASRRPIVATTQSLLNRSKGGIELGSIGYTSAFGQDADVIFGVERQKDSTISKFKVVDSRSGPRQDTFLDWDWDRGIVTERQEEDFKRKGNAPHESDKD